MAPLPKAAAPLRTAHGDEGLGVHDHDLALGSGSFDGILGLAGFWGRHRLFATLDLQYALRREGDHHYRFANDLTWSLNPGYYSLLDHHRSLGLGLGLSGEIKGEDEVHGASAEDTALTAVYLGPTLSFSRGDHLAADAALELPLVQDNAAFQVVPSYRLKLGVTGRF